MPEANKGVKLEVANFERLVEVGLLESETEFFDAGVVMTRILSLASETADHKGNGLETTSNLACFVLLMLQQEISNMYSYILALPEVLNYLETNFASTHTKADLQDKLDTFLYYERVMTDRYPAMTRELLAFVSLCQANQILFTDCLETITRVQNQVSETNRFIRAKQAAIRLQLKKVRTLLKTLLDNSALLE